MIRVYLSVFICLFLSNSYTQQYSFIQYSIEHGLPQTQISSIVQDSQGYLWIGSVGGVSRFNGIDFQNYSKADGLIDNQINCLLGDESDNIWLGCNGGISIISGKKIKRHYLKAEHSGVSIRTLYIDGDYLYLGSRSNGLFRCSLSSLSDTITDLQQIGNDNLRIRGLVAYGNELLVGTNEGLKMLQSDSLVYYLPELDSLNVTSLASKGSELWLSTIQEGVFHYNGQEVTHYDDQYGSLKTTLTRSIIIDQNGDPWVGSRTGLEHLENGEFVSFDSDNGLINDNIKVVFEDVEGNIWIGSDGAGIFKFSGDRFVALTESEGIASDLVMSFTEDTSGMWISTYGGGITNYRKDKILNYQDPAMLSHTLIWCSMVDKQHRVWFGTTTGITIKDEDGVHPFELDRIIDNVRITSLIEHDGKIFIGHRNGLAYYENGTITHFETEARIIRTMVELPDGSLLIGSSNGLYKYLDGEIQKLAISNDIDLYPVYCMASLDQDRFWVGNPNGLFMVTKGEAKKYRLGPSSGHNFINFLLRESDEVLWAGTNHGIYEINVPSFTSPDGLVLRNYTPEDGTRSYETNLNAAYKSEDGVLWFGTIGGVIMFKRSGLQTKNEIPKPILGISEIQLSLNKTDWSKFSDGYESRSQLPLNLTLPYQKNHLTFHFIGISHSYPKQVKYQTILEGFDDIWNPISQTRFITYSNLPPGTYTFKVRATIDEENWTSERNFSFTINAPFWRTWWFITLLALLVIGILIIIYRVRLQAEANKRKTESLIYKTRLMNLEQQSLNASMNRHFIFNALNSIQYYINRQDKLSANRYLSSFAKLIRKNLDSSSSPDNLVQLSEELERLDLYISLEHMRFQNKFDYEINIDPKIDTESLRVPAMFLQPYVENSIWHGILPMKRPGKIEVNITEQDDNIKFVIQDNGIGIDQSLEKKSVLGSAHDSKGMKITSSRINVLRKITKRNIQIFGPFEVKNGENEPAGTKVEIIFPMEKNATFNKNSR